MLEGETLGSREWRSQAPMLGSLGVSFERLDAKHLGCWLGFGGFLGSRIGSGIEPYVG